METEDTKVFSLLNKQKKMRAKRQRKEAPPKIAQNVLQYEKMYESGICELEGGLYSKSFQFEDVNYQIAQREDQMNIFGDYCELLNSCDSSTHLNVTIMNKKIDVEAFEKALFYEEKGDGQDVYRNELNGMLGKSIKGGQNGFLKENYMTFSTTAKTLDQARQYLGRTEQTLMGSFSKMNSECTALEGIDRLEVFHHLLKPNDLFHFKYEDLVYSNLSTKSAVAPSSFNFKKSKNSFEVGSGYGAVLYLKDYPSNLTDKVVTELTEIPEELTISIHIDPVEPDEANNLVRTKKMYMESDKVSAQRKAGQQGYDPTLVPYELDNSLAQADLLLDDIAQRGQKLFYVTFLVYVRADTQEELQDIVELVKITGRKNSCGFSQLDYLQLEGINSILPLGKNFVDIQRTLTTASTAIFVPFTAQDLNHTDGKYYGINETTKNVVRVNRKKLNTPSGFIIGSSGTGKGVAKKYEEITTLLKNPTDEIISIDPEDEDSFIGEAFDAQIIKISPNTDTFINLLDITGDLNGEEDPVKLKADFLLSSFETLVGGRTGLSSASRSIIDRVTRLTYVEYFNKPGSPMPTLEKDWFPILKAQPEEAAKTLVLDLELYIEGSLSIFSKPTNVALNKRYIIYNTKQLGSQLKTFGMMVVLEQVWNRVVRNRALGITTWLYVDEMQLMLNDEYCENYFFEFWSRIRKWGAIPTGITQNIETLLLSDKARRMLSNSEFIIMLKQAKSDLDEVSELFGLSYQQEKQLVNPQKGAGLLKAGNAIVPFSNIIEKDTKFYDLVTTDPDDMIEIKKKQGV